MKIDERYDWILQTLKNKRKINSKDTAKALDVSFETVRRDFEKLEFLGKLKRVHGGAEFIEAKSDIEKNFIERENLYAEEKRIIAKKACSLVREGMSIALDVSTTNTAIARRLVRKFNKLTIISNSIPIIDIVAKAPNFTVIIPGGILYNQERCIIGDIAIDHIEKYNIDLFFMSLSGIDINEGFTDYGHEELKVKVAFMYRAKKSVVVADYSKFDQVSLIPFDGFSKVNTIITDNTIDEETKSRYKKFFNVM
ncbi:DeoR/GlpR family DNA-binding transcription regulator [Macrococcus animalis]|uniref:DeoR/GlpR family DNA-binding transcription regulator n=1 Tax=Macrococcus animalis TaxID=3395467 RepID=UPI0039BF8234